MERSLMKSRKRVDYSTESCGTPLLIGLGEEQRPSAMGETDRTERKLEMKVQGED